MFFDEIQRGLKFDEYHSVEEIKSDLLYMMDSVIVYYEGRDKDVLSRFIDYCKNLLGDCWFYYRVEDEDGFEQFLRRNQRRLKNVFWKDEVVEEIVDSAVMKLRRSRNALPVTVIRPQEILTAPMDATLMEQVILNLLENAVNHAEGATRIRVEIAGQGDTVMIAVEDDGAGFPPELLPQLFDRKLLPRSCADGRRGLGLGLTLCSAIIKAHGGRMTAENRPEGGARVCLWLPAGTEDEEETEG